MLLLRSLTTLGRARVILYRWMAESHIEFAENPGLLHAARDQFDRARSVRSGRVSWRTRRGERLDDAIGGRRPRDGVHGRCRGVCP